jgi:hypothetical protein
MLGISRTPAARENVTTSEAAYAFMIAAPRFNMALLIAFAAIGLALAAVGLAAVIGYEVAERTHEFGIRMALGARAENVRRLAMKHGLMPAFAGVVIDPLTFAGVVALLVLVALGASWLPARRAARDERGSDHGAARRLGVDRCCWISKPPAASCGRTAGSRASPC